VSRGRTERRRALAALKAASEHVDLHGWRWQAWGMSWSLACLWDGLEREHAAVVEARDVVRRWPRGGCRG